MSVESYEFSICIIQFFHSSAMKDSNCNWAGKDGLLFSGSTTILSLNIIA
jgi:hypothetical protein